MGSLQNIRHTREKGMCVTLYTADSRYKQVGYNELSDYKVKLRSRGLRCNGSPVYVYEVRHNTIVLLL